MSCRLRACIVSALLTALSGCGANAKHVQTDDTATIKVRVAREAMSEFALTAGSSAGFPEVRLEDGPTIPGMRTYRAWIARDHWHAYTLAVIDGKTYALGGFQNPDLVSIARARSAKRASTSDVNTQARELAMLADDEGAVEYVFMGQADSKSTGVTRQRIIPGTWPTDTVIEVDGLRMVRVTLVSRATRSFTQHWVPTVYTFLFNPQNELVAWRHFTGDEIAATQLSLRRVTP